MIDRSPLIFPPPWAEAWGDDRYGLWAELCVKEVTQRMRWIAPGSFMMGSPEDEPGHRSDESPQHQVTLSEGLWLADTACTQALWQVVTGDNPGRFKGEADLPVEQVSWEDVQAFLGKQQALLPEDSQALLPSEAE